MNQDILKHKHKILSLQITENEEKIKRIQEANLKLEQKRSTLLNQIRVGRLENEDLAPSRKF